MMMQSWMGTDLTNDDLIKQSSTVVDYTHKLLGSEAIQGLDCWKLELIPKEEATVVWGKIITWIDKADYMQMKMAGSSIPHFFFSGKQNPFLLQET